MSKYNVGDRLISFYKDEQGQQRTRKNDLKITNVPPFTDDKGEEFTDKYGVYDHNLNINRKILKTNIENDNLYIKFSGGKKQRKSKKYRKSKKHRKSKKR